MRMKALMERAQISRDTLRFYEREGLITPPERGSNGYREFDGRVLDEIRFIRIAQSVGFGLAEIKRAIPYVANPKPGCPHLRAALERQLSAINEKIDQLTRARARVERWLERVGEARVQAESLATTFSTPNRKIAVPPTRT